MLYGVICILFIIAVLVAFAHHEHYGQQAEKNNSLVDAMLTLKLKKQRLGIELHTTEDQKPPIPIPWHKAFLAQCKKSLQSLYLLLRALFHGLRVGFKAMRHHLSENPIPGEIAQTKLPQDDPISDGTPAPPAETSSIQEQATIPTVSEQAATSSATGATDAHNSNQTDVASTNDHPDVSNVEPQSDSSLSASEVNPANLSGRIPALNITASTNATPTTKEAPIMENQVNLSKTASQLASITNAHLSRSAMSLPSSQHQGNAKPTLPSLAISNPPATMNPPIAMNPQVAGCLPPHITTSSMRLNPQLAMGLPPHITASLHQVNQFLGANIQWAETQRLEAKKPAATTNSSISPTLPNSEMTPEQTREIYENLNAVANMKKQVEDSILAIQKEIDQANAALAKQNQKKKKNDPDATGEFSSQEILVPSEGPNTQNINAEKTSTKTHIHIDSSPTVRHSLPQDQSMPSTNIPGTHQPNDSALSSTVTQDLNAIQENIQQLTSLLRQLEAIDVEAEVRKKTPIASSAASSTGRHQAKNKTGRISTDHKPKQDIPIGQQPNSNPSPSSHYTNYIPSYWPPNEDELPPDPYPEKTTSTPSSSISYAYLEDEQEEKPNSKNVTRTHLPYPKDQGVDEQHHPNGSSTTKRLAAALPPSPPTQKLQFPKISSSSVNERNQQASKRIENIKKQLLGDNDLTV